MKTLLIFVFCVSLSGIASLAQAKGSYNDVAADDAQFTQCIAYAKKNWEGGDEKSPIAGQSKQVAFCECMWNETPEDFKGNLAKFSETENGKKINKICEKYSDWGN